MCESGSRRDLLRAAAERLRPVAGEAAAIEAQILAAHVLGRDRTWLLTHLDEPPQEATAFKELVARREGGTPLPYLTGVKEFFGLALHVTPDTLIPRPETETLVERFLEMESNLPLGPIADVGTGCGCILAAALAHTDRRGIGTEISPRALRVAVGNWRDLGAGARVTGVITDLLRGIAPGSLAAVLANLPYVADGDPRLDPAVAAHEPPAALFAGPDGLRLIRALIPQARHALKPGGALFLEFGIGQDERVRALLNGWRRVEILPDLAGIPRIAAALRP